MKIKSKCRICGGVEEFEAPNSGFEKRRRGVSLVAAFPETPINRLAQMARSICPSCQLNAPPMEIATTSPEKDFVSYGRAAGPVNKIRKHDLATVAPVLVALIPHLERGEVIKLEVVEGGEPIFFWMKCGDIDFKSGGEAYITFKDAMEGGDGTPKI